MNFNAIIAAVTCKNSIGVKPNGNSARHKYMSQKYHERSIINRYFK